MASEWIEIINAEEDTVEWEILDFAEARELWDENGKALSKYTVLRDVLPFCDSYEITSEEYDFDFPGRSGINFIIETNDPEQFVLEIRQRIEELIRPPSTSLTKPLNPTPSKIDNVGEIVDFLMGEAAKVRNLRAPAGYQILATGTADNLEAAARELCQGHWDNARISLYLSSLLDRVAVQGTKSAIKKIIGSLK